MNFNHHKNDTFKSTLKYFQPISIAVLSLVLLGFTGCDPSSTGTSTQQAPPSQMTCSDLKRRADSNDKKADEYIKTSKRMQQGGTGSVRWE